MICKILEKYELVPFLLKANMALLSCMRTTVLRMIFLPFGSRYYRGILTINLYDRFPNKKTVRKSGTVSMADS